MIAGDFQRWMYRGGRPNRLARTLNRALALVFARGIARNYLVTLEVARRRSGRRMSLPLVMVIVDGQRYLVSMLGENAAWVRNIREPTGRPFSNMVVVKKFGWKKFSPASARLS